MSSRKRVFSDDEVLWFSYKHSRQMIRFDQPEEYVKVAAGDNSEKQQALDNGERKPVLEQSEDQEHGGDPKVQVAGDAKKVLKESHYAFIPNAASTCVLGNAADSISFTSCLGKDVRSECDKHPFSNYKSHELAYRDLEEVDQENQLGAFVGSAPRRIFERPTIAVASSKKLGDTKIGTIPDEPAETAPCIKSCLSQAWWNRSVEDIDLESTGWAIPSLPFFNDYRTARMKQREEIYSPVFHSPPQRCVPIGSDHQADIPVLQPRALKIQESTTHKGNQQPNDKHLGTCIIPMPDGLETHEGVGAGICKIKCRCLDEGSIRCVKQRVMEAREHLRTMLGHDGFKELGFSDMGEDVSYKWSEEEEQAFHEVVFSNPPSLGRNFWKYLPLVFPSRSSRELVSYYFNVFMLRKRARQNVSEPLYADSDNDEWQESDDGDCTSEEDEGDSALCSPRAHHTVANGSCDRGEVEIHKEDDTYGCGDFEGGNKDNDGCVLCSKEWTSCRKLNNVSDLQFAVGDLQNGLKDLVTPDDSCTSFESQHNLSDSSQDQPHLLGENNMGLQWEGKDERLSDLTDNGYMIDQYDPKLWETGYSCGREQQINFSPTSNVIEEVFGKGNWNNMARDN